MAFSLLGKEKKTCVLLLDVSAAVPWMTAQRTTWWTSVCTALLLIRKREKQCFSKGWALVLVFVLGLQWLHTGTSPSLNFVSFLPLLQVHVPTVWFLIAGSSTPLLQLAWVALSWKSFYQLCWYWMAFVSNKSNFIRVIKRNNNILIMC